MASSTWEKWRQRPQIAPSKRVNIHTDKGIVDAVFGWPAIHTRHGGEEKSPKLDNIFLDCGCSSKKEVEKLGVHVGCVVTYKDELMILNNKYYVGRALDNRIGGFIIAEVARLLKENKKKLPFGLYCKLCARKSWFKRRTNDSEKIDR